MATGSILVTDTPHLRNISEDRTEIGIERTYCQLYSNMQGTPANIQTPTHWNR